MSVIGIIYLALILLLLGTLASTGVALRHREVLGVTLGSAVRLLVGLAMFAGILYVTAYFLGLVGGFYESLTCKVVTLPSCEDPLALPAWLGLPEASVGGVIGILPLLGIFLAKSMQPRRPRSLAGLARAEPFSADAAAYTADAERIAARGHQHPRFERLSASFLAWLGANASLIGIFLIELWLAWLRGAAEATDRQVRLSLGLDAELPAAYLGVAQWGAVVLALGLSVVVLYLGVGGRFALGVAGRGFAGVAHGAGFVELVGAVLAILASGLKHGWTVSAIAIGRFALKTQSALTRLYVLALSALGRLLLKLQSAVMRAWAFLAILIGRFVLFLSRVFARVGAWIGSGFRRRPRTEVLGVALAALVLAGAGGLARAATTYVVLQDASGGEASRLEAANKMVLSWADPSPQLALLERHDRLIVIPVRAPGALDTVYAALFNAAYPGSQLDRFAFFAELRSVLPDGVDPGWGTGLSEALRTAVFYLRDAPPDHERVLVVFGNGEDHSAEPIDPEELAPALEGAVVLRLNAGLQERDYWTSLYEQGGAKAQLVYDQASTRLLSVAELQQALARVVGTE